MDSAADSSRNGPAGAALLEHQAVERQLQPVASGLEPGGGLRPAQRLPLDVAHGAREVETARLFDLHLGLDDQVAVDHRVAEVAGEVRLRLAVEEAVDGVDEGAVGGHRAHPDAVAGGEARVDVRRQCEEGRVDAVAGAAVGTLAVVAIGHRADQLAAGVHHLAGEGGDDGAAPLAGRSRAVDRGVQLDRVRRLVAHRAGPHGDHRRAVAGAGVGVGLRQALGAHRIVGARRQRPRVVRIAGGLAVARRRPLGQRGRRAGEIRRLGERRRRGAEQEQQRRRRGGQDRGRRSRRVESLRLVVVVMVASPCRPVTTRCSRTARWTWSSAPGCWGRRASRRRSRCRPAPGAACRGRSRCGCRRGSRGRRRG